MDTTPNSTTQPTVMEQFYFYVFGHNSSPGARIALIIGMAILVHLAVKIIRSLSEWLIKKSYAEEHPLKFIKHQPKLVTFIQLVTHGITFVMYFLAVGLLLEELGMNLKGYLASASIVALAISFGSQGLVQDVVISLTLIFSDAMDVGDMVEIVGTVTVVGRVEEIGLRFTLLRNFYNQVVFIPNRTIANVSRFSHGGIYAYVDVQLPTDVPSAQPIQAIKDVTQGAWSQFNAIILNEPVVNEAETAQGGKWNFVRIHFIIWPGQGDLIETTFRQQIITAMKSFQPNYNDWQVSVTYRTPENMRIIKGDLFKYK